ncbi:MAG: ATP-dependent Clp protease proteolytic subunit, partial [Myxococcaceae bacterium]
MDRRAGWIIGSVFGGLFLLLFGFLFVLYLAVKMPGGSLRGGGDKVGIVEIVGEIRDSKKTLEQLRDFRDADHIKAVVVRIDSPGGAVGPSQEIYEAVHKLREKKKVVVSMGSTAASGGFYIACAGETVFAN